MFKKTGPSVMLATLLCHSVGASAASDADLQSIRLQIEQLKQNYEQRIEQLEQRLQRAEAAAKVSQAPVAQALMPAQTNIVKTVASGGEGTFNPAISLILTGNYATLKQNPALAATGFAMSSNPVHQQGFNLGESELGINANIDADYRGVATLALASNGGVSVENAFVQSSALGYGLNLKFGRYFSGLGYLNEQHAHAWDFIDQPLVYASFWNNQLGEDGIQLKWLAPLDTFIEVGGEFGRGRGFPGTDRNKNGAGSSLLYMHIGDDIGVEHSWRAGASLHRTQRIAAISDAVPDLPGTPGGVSNSFSGDSRTAGLDFVWKYSPDGNISKSSLKLQGEYFRRKESGRLAYDIKGINTTDSYAVTQSGWYLQGVYQFMPRWRTGLRHDRLDPGTAATGASNVFNIIGNYGFQPGRTSWMLDYNASEFSRLRLQLARDNSRRGLPDDQIFLQYLMSLGAHGAHSY